MMTQQLYIGIMSGTSMDGADAVLIAMQEDKWQGALAHYFVPYTQDLRVRLLALQNTGNNELHRAEQLGIELAHIYAQAVQGLLTKSQNSASNIRAIGCHGQTVRHAPEHEYSIQLGNLAKLAQLTQIFTIGDFRSGDLAHGGQGAPLVPAFHQAVFADKQQTRVVLNIGGIANISVLQPNAAPFGFDTGAGNMLMDAWTQHHWQFPFDKDGNKAAQGKLLPELLAKLMAHPYFAQAYPKSTGRELFSLTWLQNHLNGNESPYDVLRTLLHFTADTIAQAIFQTKIHVDAIYICGGGAHNPLLIKALQHNFATQQQKIVITDTHALNLNPQWVEAAAFAWLASSWCNQIPSNPHHATGAKKAVILGAGYFA